VPKNHRTIPILLAGLLCLALLPTAARAHQCIDVEVLEAPEIAHVGQMIHVTGWALNCGDPTRGFRLGWVLVDEMGDRIHLGGGGVKLRPEESETAEVRLLLPTRIRPGHYTLVLVGRAPSGFSDQDAVRLQIRKAPARGDG
jgi:hypothetical protein